jgi:purine-binding chemotaxis protein CheW
MNDFAQKNSADFASSALNLSRLDASFFNDEQFAQSKGEKYIVFCLGEKFFGVSSEKVSEVVQRLSITPLPNVPDWLVGIADLRGRIISVVSLEKLLDAPGASFSPKTKFIVLKSQKFPSSVAIAADRLSEIVVLKNEEIHLVENEKTPYLLGRTMYKSNALDLLNVDNLLASLTIK